MENLACASSGIANHGGLGVPSAASSDPATSLHPPSNNAPSNRLLAFCCPRIGDDGEVASEQWLIAEDYAQLMQPQEQDATVRHMISDFGYQNMFVVDEKGCICRGCLWEHTSNWKKRGACDDDASEPDDVDTVERSLLEKPAAKKARHSSVVKRLRPCGAEAPPGDGRLTALTRKYARLRQANRQLVEERDLQRSRYATLESATQGLLRAYGSVFDKLRLGVAVPDGPLLEQLRAATDQVASFAESQSTSDGAQAL